MPPASACLPQDEPDADRSQERLNEAIATHRRDLQRELYALTERLEHAFVLGEDI